jgi:fucose permease
VPGLGLRLGLGTFALGATLLALAPSWGALLTAGFVTGLGFGQIVAAVNRAFLGGFGDRGPGMVGLVNAVYGLGAILSPLLFLWAGSRPTAVYLAIAGLAVLGLLLARPDPSPAPRGLPDLRSRRLLVTLFLFGNGLIEGASAGFGASALIDAGLAPGMAARLTSAFFAAYLLSRISLYWLARHVGPDRLFLLGTGGAGLCMALAALGAPALGFVLAGGFVGMIFPGYYVWATGILGKDPRMTSAILAVALLGGTLAPLVLRPLLGLTGEAGLFWIVAVAALSLATLFGLLKGRARALAPAPA